MIKKISNRIILAYSMLIVLLVSFLLLFFNDLVRETQLTILKREMKSKIDFVDLVMGEQKGSFTLAKIRRKPSLVRELSDIITLRVTLIDEKGRVFADSKVEDAAKLDNHLHRIEVQESRRDTYGNSVRYSTTLKTDMLYFAKDMGEVTLRLAKPLFEVDGSLIKVRKLIVFSGIFVFFTAFIIIIYISRRITSPINDTLSFARDFSHGDYSRRILNYSEDEIGSLQRSLNRMADTIVDKMNSLIFEQNKLEITLESINDGIAVIDEHKRVHIANSAFNQLLESRQAMKGRLYFEVIRSPALNSRIEYVLHRGESAEFEEKLISGVVCEVTLNPIKEHDTLQGILVVLHDITEKKRIEEFKTELVGNMSHELKTPITIMKGYLETISENIENTELSSEFIQKALENADRQNSIINDILKLNLLEKTNDFLEEDINIKEVITTCVDLLNVKAARRGITINDSIDELDMEIKGSRFLAEEVFFNLIDNAVNYNRESGFIKIMAEVKESRIRILIEDTGIGIPDESIDRIFERFYRVDKSRSRSTGGTGLGLSIVKHAAEILGWNIDVASGRKGTVFAIEI